MSLVAGASERIANRLRSLTERPQGVRLRDLVDQYMMAYTGRDSAIGTRLNAWCNMIGDYTLEKIDSEVIHACRAELQEWPALAYKGKDYEGKKVFREKNRTGAKAPATVNRYMSSIASVFSWAIENRLTPRGWGHPCRGLRRMKENNERVRFLDDAERERLFAACKASKYKRLYALVLMAITTGARRGELMALTWRDIDLANGKASLGRTKNGDRRTLVLLPQVVDVLTPFHSSDGARYVFGSVKSKYTAPASTDTAWRHAVKRAGVENFRFHDLRHCCASYLAQAGQPLNVIAEVLGHRKLDMTRRYAHLTTQTKAAAMQGALGRIGTGEMESGIVENT